ATEDAMVWQRRVARMAPAEMRAELESAGFAAVYVCRSAYIDGAKALRKSFEEAGMRVTFPNPAVRDPAAAAGPHLIFRLHPSPSPRLPVLNGPNRHEPWD